MPTHGDFPWERDARRAAQDAPRRDPVERTPAPRPAPRRRKTSSFRESVCVAILAVACIAYGAIQLTEPEPASIYAAAPHVVSSPEGAPRRERDSLRDIVKAPVPRAKPPAPAYALSRLRSRWAAPGVVEVWGRTNARDGMTIRVSGRRDGRRFLIGEAPAADGHFYLKEHVGGGGLQIRARVLR